MCFVCSFKIHLYKDLGQLRVALAMMNARYNRHLRPETSQGPGIKISFKGIYGAKSY